MQFKVARNRRQNRRRKKEEKKKRKSLNRQNNRDKTFLKSHLNIQTAKISPETYQITVKQSWGVRI